MGKGQGPGETTRLVDSKGPQDLEGRSCTDLVCLLIFGAFMVVLLTIWAVVLGVGDINKVLYGVDYLGNTCGHAGGNISKLPKVWYPRISKDIAEQPHKFAAGAWWDIDLYGLCVEDCPQFHLNKIEIIPDYGVGEKGNKQASWEVYLDTTDVINRCIPKAEQTSTTLELCTQPTCYQTNVTCSKFAGTMGIPSGAWEFSEEHPASQCSRQIDFTYDAKVVQPGSTDYLNWVFRKMTQVNDVLSTVHSNWGLLLICGIVFSLLINFMWLVIFYCFAGCAVWLAIGFIWLSLVLASVFSFVKAGVGQEQITNFDPENTDLQSIHGYGTETLQPVDDEYKVILMTSGWICCILAVVFVIFICCARKAIDRAIVLIRQASLALGSTSGLALMPIIISILQLGFFILSIFVVMVLPTLDMTGSLEERVSEYDNTWWLWIMFLYIIFGFIWTYCFMTALTNMTTAACVFYFYFVNKKTVPTAAYMTQYDDNQTGWPVMKHLGWVCRYHLGTVAFGSAILAIVSFIQLLTKALFAYLEKNVGSNPVLQICSCCVQCCLACFKKTIEFISSYAYIYCFVENVGFCSGCMKTFALCIRYPSQVAINTIVQRVLATLLTVTTPLACGAIAFAYFDFIAPDADSHKGQQVLLLPMSVALLALLMTFAFASIWEQVVQSLTVCVIHDVESFDGKFLRDSMREAFDHPVKPLQEKKTGTASP